MKVSYQIEERKYSDGTSRFYPKVHDWWHGWRYLLKRNTQDWVEDSGKVCFGSLSECQNYIDGVIRRKRTMRDDEAFSELPRCIGVVEHQYQETEKES